MHNIKHKILVLSGKGGVGKSTIAVNLAVWLSMQENNVGLLDIDLHGPSVPKLLALEDKRPAGSPQQIEPIMFGDSLKVMSVGFLLNNENEPIIWRGPMKHNLIKQFVSDTTWDKLDYLVVDCPPGTGDEPLSIAQSIHDIDGALIVTTPQQLAIADVRKCISFCLQLQLPIIGVIENMAGFICPDCGHKTDIFIGDGGRQLAGELNVNFLGSIPIDPYLVMACDTGKPVIRSETASPSVEAMKSVFTESLKRINEMKPDMEVKSKMRIAIPLTGGKLSSHFGHCEQFAVIDVDPDKKTIAHTELFTPPQHEPGILPKWLGGLCVHTVIAGGMGQRAQSLFQENNIDVVVGAPQAEAEQIVSDYLDGSLSCGQNVCDH